MSETPFESLSISGCLQYIIVSLWIGLCVSFYFLQKTNKSLSDVQEESKSDVPVIKFTPPLSSTIHLLNQSNVTQSDNFPIMQESCNPGRLTINPWLNFVRHFRSSYCGIRHQKQLLREASAVWQNMSDEQKEPFRIQADECRSMRESSKNYDN